MKLKQYMALGFGLIVVIALVFIGKALLKDDEMVYNNEPLLHENQLIKEVYTDLSRYNPEDNAGITIELENRTSNTLSGDIYIILKYLDEIKTNKKVDTIKLDPGDNKTLEASIALPKEDFKGYLLEVWLKKGKDFIDFNSTGIDVSSDWTKFPRYGYIANFHEQDVEKTSDIIQNLNKYHINGLQFYDWQYKHQEPVLIENGQLADNWIELANRKVSAKTVKDYISEGHKYNMASMNYNLLFGAWKDFADYNVSKEWGIYRDKNGQEMDYHPLPKEWASDKIYLFNPLNPQWQDYIIGKEKEVFDYLDFDGWHIDQLGHRGELYDIGGNPIDLLGGYVSLINAAKEQLKDKNLVFNAVNGYGQSFVAKQTDVDFLYTEVWSTDNYSFLKQYIDQGFRFTDYQKSTVLAAYMNYGKQSGEFNEASVRLTDAVIFASGGSHLELGDGGMLSSEYFPNDKLMMSESLKASLIKYYDFLTAYENFLRDGVKPINRKIVIEDIKTSTTVMRKSVWYFAKEKEQYEILQLINFLNNSSNDWRDDSGNKEEPPLMEDLVLKYYTKEKMSKVLCMSPDYNASRVTALEYKEGSDDKGQFIEITVPKLHYWDMILFEKDINE